MANTTGDGESIVSQGQLLNTVVESLCKQVLTNDLIDFKQPADKYDEDGFSPHIYKPSVKSEV